MCWEMRKVLVCLVFISGCEPIHLTIGYRMVIFVVGIKWFSRLEYTVA